MKMNSLRLLFFLLFVSFQCFAQNISDVERLLESNNIESTEDGYEDMLNTLLYLSKYPIDLNTAGFDSLKMLFFLSDSQIDELLKFRQKHGEFRDIHELLLVPGFGQRDLENISSFIALDCSRGNSFSESIRTRHEILARVKTALPLAEGYKRYAPYLYENEKDYNVKVKNRFYGPPLGTLFKYKYIYNQQVQGGIVLENDPGEGYFTRHQKIGFDFLSMYLAYAGKRWLRQVVVGDYKLQWGQGLVAWGGFSMGKSGVAVGNEKSGKGFILNTSTDENKFMRGVAFSFAPKSNMTLDVFFSYKKNDGTLTPLDTIEHEEYVKVSLCESGYHRNDNECAKKRALKTLASGVSYHWNTSAFKVGLNTLFYNFRPGLLSGEQIYQQYADDGMNRWMFSVDYKTAIRGIYLFGETAVCDRGAIATVNGMRIGKGAVAGCLLYRYYGKRYISHYAAGFGEFSNTSNEEGVYCGLDVDLLKGLKLSLYYDWFRFFSARYMIAQGDWGWELLGCLVYAHSIYEHSLRYKREVRPEDLSGGIPALRCKHEIRYQLACHWHERWECRTRASMLFYKKAMNKEKGIMVYQDIIYQDIKEKFKMQCRVAWFNTDSYQSRLYAFENNALYAYSFPSFMKEGWRSYINLAWKPIKGLTCYFKSGITIYSGQDSIGSGLMRITGNKKYDMLLQIRFTI